MQNCQKTKSVNLCKPRLTLLLTTLAHATIGQTPKSVNRLTLSIQVTIRNIYISDIQYSIFFIYFYKYLYRGVYTLVYTFSQLLNSGTAYSSKKWFTFWLTRFTKGLHFLN